MYSKTYHILFDKGSFEALWCFELFFFHLKQNSAYYTAGGWFTQNVNPLKSYKNTLTFVFDCFAAEW